MSHYLILAAVLLVIVAYPFLMRAIATRIQPLRLRMATLGNQLVDTETLTPSQRFVLGSLMRDAYDYRIAFALALGFPVFVFGIIFGLINAKNHNFPSTKEFEEFTSLHVLSVAAANPLCFAVFVVEMMVFAPILIPFVVFRAKYSSSKPADMMVLANIQIDRSLRHLPA